MGAGAGGCHHPNMGWVLFVTAGILMLVGARLLLAEARRSESNHRNAIAARFGLVPHTESGFGLHGFGAHEPSSRVIHAGWFNRREVAILWDVQVPFGWRGDRYRMAVLVRAHPAVPESSIEKTPGSELVVRGDARWLDEALRPVLESATHWFRIETAGDQLIVLENFSTKRSSVSQVARMFVMALGVLQLPTSEVEAVAEVEETMPSASRRLLAGYSLMAMGGMAVLAGIGVS